ncbi:MAG: hypothetical protein ACP5O2_10590 [Bacteroidales bacterium]
MYKLEVSLKQHTPLIHFQWSEEGATLRASEVKPKLDRFLINKIGKRSIKQQWTKEIKDKQNSEKLSLDYKLWITEDENDKKIYYIPVTNLPKSYNNENNIKKDIADILESRKANIHLIKNTPYFANQEPLKNENLNETKLAVVNNGNIKVTILTKHVELYHYIKENIEEFFCVNNFGQRQSKGFGTFYLKSTTEDILEKALEKNFQKFIKLSKSINSIEDLFKKIDKDYKTIKNNPSGETLVKEYFSKKQGISWEKEYISKVVAQKGKKESFEGQNIYFVRALLGLPTFFDYPQLKPKMKVEIKNADFERFSSPLTFKVFYRSNKHYQIYIAATENYKIIINQKFKFKCEGREETLNTPEDFDIIDFMEFIEPILANRLLSYSADMPKFDNKPLY